MGILIYGHNGVGKRTIGRILADILSYQFIDNEDLYFPKDDKSYMFSNPRSKDEVIHLLEEKIEPTSEFVFAAVKGDYGDKLLSKINHVYERDLYLSIMLDRSNAQTIERQYANCKSH